MSRHSVSVSKFARLTAIPAFMAGAMLAAPAGAHVISVTTSPSSGQVDVTINSVNKGDGDQPVHIYDGDGASIADGKTDAAGGYTTKLSKDHAAIASVTIGTGAGESTYSRVVTTKDGKTKTRWITQDEAKSQNNGNNEFRMQVTPFQDDSGVFRDGGVENGQFMLINGSTSASYLITRLDIYTGVDEAFFTGGGFDSAAAIATGALFYDAAASGTTLTIGPDDGSPFGRFLTFPIGEVGYDGYALLVGVAQEELPGGGLGAPLAFSSAITAIPEPPAWALTICGLLLMGRAIRRSRRTVTARPVAS